MADKKKKHKPYWLKKIEFTFLKFGVRLIEKLSVDSSYVLADFIGSLVFFVDRKHRNRAITHILHSGICTTRSDAVSLGRESFRHMLKVFVEIIKSSQLVTAENYQQFYELDDVNPEWNAFFRKPDSPQAILASGHIGNWELAGSAYSLLSGVPLVSIMRPLENELIGNFFYEHRAVFNHTTVSKEKGIRPLLSALNSGKTIAIVADQHAVHTEGVEIDFCGHPARAHMTPSLLSLKTKVPIICVLLIRTGRFKFKLTGCGPVHYTPTGDKEIDIRAVTQLYSSLLEECLRKYPEQWLWPHRRWLDCNRKSHHRSSNPKERKQS